jgi:hypothetical protein
MDEKLIIFVQYVFIFIELFSVISYIIDEKSFIFIVFMFDFIKIFSVIIFYIMDEKLIRFYISRAAACETSNLITKISFKSVNKEGGV